MTHRLLVLLLVVLGTIATGCAGLLRKDNYYSINADGSRSLKYSRINEYTSYGQGGLGAQGQIAAAYEDAQHAPPPAIEIEVYNAALPAGVTLDDGVVQIAKGAPYESVGRFEIGYWLDSAPQETEIEDDLKRLAAVTGANVVVVEVTRMGHGDTRVNYLSGLVLRKLAPAGAPGALATIAPAARGDRPRAKARLVYTAKPRGCLTAAELADEISAKLGYSPWVASAADPLSVEIVQRGREYVATVEVARGAKKALTGATCKTVTDAAISVIVVQLDAPPLRYD